MPCSVAMLVIKHFEQRSYILPYGPSDCCRAVSELEYLAQNLLIGQDEESLCSEPRVSEKNTDVF